MNIAFRHVTSPESVATYLADKIAEQLVAGKRVLWLVAGGSAIDVTVRVAKKLQDAPLQNLVVSLTDERYGPVGHPDSNWQQMEAAGFSLPGASLKPVLTGKDQATTVEEFAKFLDSELSKADYKLGFFGIGPDGHTSGILPGTPAVTATGLAYGYDGGSYQRVTTTNEAIKRLDEAVVYAMGEAKRPVLDQLETDVPLAEQPAQILKQVPTFLVFSDQKGQNI